MVDKKVEENLAQFCTVTGATQREGRKYLDKYKQLEIAIDAYYSDPSNLFTSTKPSTSKLNVLFDEYKDPDSDAITIDGTIKLCEDLEVDPEDVVLLSVAYELKSPRLGLWTRQGWVDGWKNNGCDSINKMKTTLEKLKQKLGSEPAYFDQVYAYTFEFGRGEGQRSMGTETAQAFWGLLIPHGLKYGALTHVYTKDKDNDVKMSGEDGWKEEYTQWWFDYLNGKGGKGVSKDTWAMFLDFVRSINSDFSNYDIEAAWPSTIDDFVEYAKVRRTRIDSGA